MSSKEDQKSSTNLKGYGATSNRSNSSDQSMDANKEKKTRNQNLYICGSLFIMIIFLLALKIAFSRGTPILYNNIQFDFHVYCPISFEKNLMKKQKSFFDYLPFSFKTLPYNNIFERTYVVNVRSVQVKNENDVVVDQQFQYCSLARSWDGTCENPAYVCSNPGPAFDLKTNEQVYVFWVNQVETVNLNFANIQKYDRVNDCYQTQDIPDEGNEDYPSRCFQKSKSDTFFGCTYKDPTDLGENETTYEHSPLAYDNFPISAHVHGLEVRPYFDGNPLSWISRKARGIGFMSYEQKYFNSISERQREIIYHFYNTSEKFVKMNVYPNTQLPGSLWYHDHSMASTGFNVAKGLNGMYILRDNKTESDLPKGDYQTIILLHMNTEQLTICHDKAFNMNAWYRFRILNSNFNKHYQDIRFLTPNNEIIEYTLIGQDSSLMKQLKSGLTTFSLASAERVDLLIRFDSSVLNEGDVVKLTYTDDGANVTLIPIDIAGEDTTQNYSPPSQLDVPFKNLTDSDIQVDKTRMRPLFRKGGVFSVNAHMHFDSGKSENPRIGTTEDWFMINTITIPHPFHVHLINYQIIKDYTLKFFDTAEFSCSYYEIDFYLKYANKTACFPSSIQKRLTQPPAQDLYDTLCDYVQGDAMTKEKMIDCFGEFGNEQQFVNGISGIDVEKEIDGPFKYDKAKSTCSSTHRYICNNVSDDIPVYNRGWKEVAYVKEGHALAFRIRWTKTAYDPIADEENYFHVPGRDLIEFPGYVYHCHFLPHEDNEMMRPIMMQPARSIANHTFTKTPWQVLYKGVNHAIGCGTIRQDRNNDLRRI